MENQKLITEIKTIGINDTIVMPTHRELIKARDFNIPVIFSSPYAVFIRKIAKSQINTINNSLSIDKGVLQGLHKDFITKDFFVNFQYGKGVSFNDEALSYMEGIQQIPELKRLFMNEPTEHQTNQEFSTQLTEWKSRNNRKLLVPVLDPATNEMLNKISTMKKNKIKECAVIFRGFTREEDKNNLNMILQNLRVAGISSIVFGIFFKKWKKTWASMFLPPLQFKANAMATYIPWGAKEIKPMELLCSVPPVPLPK